MSRLLSNNSTIKEQQQQQQQQKKQGECPDFFPITQQLKSSSSNSSNWQILWITESLSMYIHISMQNNIVQLCLW
jgi:hypothetical protein